MASGERFCLLVDPASGVPLFHPNLFVTTQVRNRSLSASAVEAALAAVNVLCSFCSQSCIQLEIRFRQRRFLELSEIDALRDFCQRHFGPRVKTCGTVVVRMRTCSRQRSPRKVGLSSEYTRLTYIANYISWLAHTLLVSAVDELIARQIESTRKQILSRRPSKRGRNALGQPQGLGKGQISRLLEVINPASGMSPFDDAGTRARNRLIILLLLYLGIRGGELLSLRTRDIDWSCNQVVIARRPDEKSDPRGRQPLVKTLDRRLALRDTLAKELHDYVIGHRNKIPGARKHDFLFVTHKSGPTQGQPLSISGYQKVIRVVAETTPELEHLHGHLLRHTWNDRFSEQMDAMENPPSPEQQEKVRSYSQGWMENSGTAATYTRRFTERKSHEAQLTLQEGMSRLPWTLKDD